MNKQNIISFVLAFLFVIILNSCGILKQSPKTAFVDGVYSQKIEHKKQKVYIDINEDEDVLRIYSIKKNNKQITVDSTEKVYLYPKKIEILGYKKSNFSKCSFDVDFLTIPLKYRFATTDAYQQLNANLNGAIYLGFRKDNYTVKYKTNPFNKSKRSISHYGFSFGICTGIGNTAMNPTNTNNKTTQEYDGVVWAKGITGIMAIDNLTVGLTAGFDNLLDKNNTIWVYENKPWIGLSFGLNLN